MNKIDVVNNMYNAAVAGDWEELGKYVTDDFAVVESEGTPYAGRYEGTEGFQQVVKKVFSYYEDFAIEQKSQCVGDKHVMVLVGFKGKGKKTGKSFESELVEMFVFEGNKVSEIRPFYWDQKLIIEV